MFSQISIYVLINKKYNEMVALSILDDIQRGITIKGILN